MAQHTVLLARALAARGHDLTIITTRDPGGRTLEIVDGVSVHYLPATEPGSQRGGWWRASATAFTALHAEQPFDVVWSQGAGALSVARTLTRGRPPHLLAMIQGTSLQLVRSLANTATVASAPRLLRRIGGALANYAIVDPLVYRTAGAVVAASRATADAVCRHHGVWPSRVHVVPNAIDAQAFARRPDERARVRAACGFTDDDVVLLSTSVLNPQKGVHVTIEALGRLAPRHPRLRLLVVGDGESRQSLEALAAARGVGSSIVFVGAQPHAAMTAYYSAGDILVFPTLRVEGFAFVLLEAMAAGLPLVATDLGGNAEAIDEGKNGFLIPAGDVDALVDRLSRLLDDRALRRCMAEHGRHRALTEFDQPAHTARIETIAETLIASSSRRVRAEAAPFLRICMMSVQTPVHAEGGMAEHTEYVAHLLAGLGHDVTLITTRHPRGHEHTFMAGVATHYLPDTQPGSHRGGWWQASARTFQALHAAKPFDVVLSKSTGAAGVARLVAPGARPPIVAMIHGTSPQMVQSIVNGIRFGLPLSALPANVRRTGGHLTIGVPTERALFAAADMIIVATSVVAASMRRWFPRAVPRVRRLAYAVDAELFSPDAGRRRHMRDRLGVTDVEPLLLFVGVLNGQKGLKTAIDALDRVRETMPHTRLVVVGEGEMRAYLEAYARRRMPSDAVTFVGGVPHRELADYYRAADVFVMPTVRIETFGLVLGEAMACEVPVVASRIGATVEVVADGETGLLVAPGDADAVARATTALLRDPARARAMGVAGRARVRALWDPHTHARGVAALLAEAVGVPLKGHG
jgi:glycosyltransferase involved in cell wall biosynthesis